MTQVNQIIVTQYFQAKAKLEQVANEQHSILSELDSGLSREKYPTHDEAKVILDSVQELSRYFADYVENLRALARLPATIAELIRNSDAELIVTKQCLHTLHYPRGLALDLQNALYGKIPTPKHWHRVHELLNYFAYLGGTHSFGTSLLATVWGAKTLFDDQKSIHNLLEANCRLITDYAHEEDLRGLLHISDRARFLSEAEEENVESGDIDWWCDQVDSEFYEHRLEYLLENCPDPGDEKVAASLNQLVKTRAGLSQKMLERIAHFLENGG